MSYWRYLCLFAYGGVKHILYYVFVLSYFVLSYVASFSGLSIVNFPFGILWRLVSPVSKNKKDNYLSLNCIFQEWSLQLQIESRRRLNCETLNELESSDDIRTNVGLSLRKNYSNIIGAWFREIQHFLPKFKTCLHIKDCKHFLTVSKLNYFKSSTLV